MSDTPSINSMLNQRVRVNDAHRSTPNLKIINLPESVRDSDRPQKLRGEIIAVGNDGTVRIKTDRGEIKALPERGVQLKTGDQVEIKIEVKVVNSEQVQSQNANIRLTLKSAVQANQPPKDLTVVKPHINIPPTLNAAELIDSAPIKTQALTSQEILKITIPYIEDIDANLNLISIKSMQKPAILPVDTLPILDNVNITQPEISPQNSILYKSPALELIAPSPDLIGNDLSFSTQLQKPVLEIPLNIVMAQVFSSPAEQPIVMDKISLDAPHPLAIIAEVNITAISPAPAEIEHISDDTIPREKAGETRAVLVGFTEDKNFPVLQIITPKSAEKQHYALQTPTKDLTIGAQVQIEITKVETPSINTAAAPPIISAHTQFISESIWPIMQELSQALTAANPQVAQAFINTMPNPAMPKQLGAAALFFLAAMRGGDVQSWLGERAVDTLKRVGKLDILNRLGSEISTLARTSAEPVAQEWRALTLPLAWQNDVHKMLLHYRKESDEGNDGEQSSGEKTRFIMDLNLSEMGKVQLDGLFIGNPQGSARLDLILRTEQNFSAAIKQEMRGAYKIALDDTNFTGELNFQGQKDSWVHITPDVKPSYLENI